MADKPPKVTMFGASNARQVVIKLNDEVVYDKKGPEEPIVIYKKEEQKEI